MTRITTSGFTSQFVNHLTEYMELVLGLGRDFRTEASLLRAFDRFVIERGHVGPLTSDVVIDFAFSVPDLTKAHYQRRHMVVRLFAQYLQFFDPETEVPAPFEPSNQSEWRLAHIYTDDEVSELLDAALQLPPIHALWSTRFSVFSPLIRFLMDRRWVSIQ